MPSATVGQAIPPDTAHAVSVSLPTWKANVGYEEGEDWVLSKMQTGYPRFFVHKSIEAFTTSILEAHGRPDEHALLFPTHNIAVRCVSFLYGQEPHLRLSCPLRILSLCPCVSPAKHQDRGIVKSTRAVIAAVVFPSSISKVARSFWQHTGEGVSSRRAEYCHKAFNEGQLCVQETSMGAPSDSFLSKGPRRYQKSSVDIKRPDTDVPLETTNPEGRDFLQFVEERFGRNLDISLAIDAKKAIRKRIAGALGAKSESEKPSDTPTVARGHGETRRVSEDDVYLYPCGMSAVFNAHRTLLDCRGSMRSIDFGFPYIDTLKILEKWGPGCVFYGHGAPNELDDLERRCNEGEKFLALVCEFPGNPLLKTPDLQRIRKIADKYDFAVVVDETIGNFVNVDVLPCADIVVSSLTKVFTGECNVMGGSLVLNPSSRYYHMLRDFMSTDYEDNYWPEDAMFMERNSRDFVTRVHRINANAEMICATLLESPDIVKEVFYPKYSPTRQNYDRQRNPDGGYGGLLSVTFYTTQQAVEFFDKLKTAKGPSLGTNFTLSSPYVILAHYVELEWVKQFGVDPDLVRISVGLEDPGDMRIKVEQALNAVRQLNN